jgi:hypothetical protein
MTTMLSRFPVAQPSVKTGTGQRVELARYTITRAGERVIFGQRVDGAVRLTDKPAAAAGRSYLIESGLHSYRELEAIVADYVRQATIRDDIPATVRCAK